MQGWEILLWVLLGIVLGLIGGFFGARYYFVKQLKKNPPINEKMIRALYMQMGRKPSESQIKQTIKAMNQYK